MIRCCEDLDVYKKAYEASLKIHRLSMDFPKHEMFELGAQIRRATKSIVMNVAEGYGKRQSTAEFKRYISMAIGSSEEVKVQLNYCKDLDYINEETHSKYIAEYTEIAKMLMGLYKKWKDLSN